MSFGNHDHPWISFIGRFVNLLKHCRQPFVRNDFGETVDSFKANRFANRVIVWQAMISASLDIDRGKIESGSVIEEVADTVDNQVVHLLHLLQGQAFEDAFDSLLHDECRTKERIGQWQ